MKDFLLPADALHPVVLDMKLGIGQLAWHGSLRVNACKGLAAYFHEFRTRLGNGMQSENAYSNAPAASGLNAQPTGHAIGGIKGRAGGVHLGVKTFNAFGIKPDLFKPMRLDLLTSFLQTGIGEIDNCRKRGLANFGWGAVRHVDSPAFGTTAQDDMQCSASCHPAKSSVFQEGEGQGGGVTFQFYTPSLQIHRTSSATVKAKR